VEATRFKGYRAAGVNRVSLGVQALDDASLKGLGRLHSAREALDAVAIARSAFERYSFDLIYARPDQTTDAWASELRLAISEAAEHLSLYQLTIEQDTPFAGLHAAGKLVIPDEGNARALYDVTQEVCAAMGLPAYEISNHARKGAESRHNLAYWTYAPYAGIGPGAHGRRNHLATERHRRPETWLTAVETTGHGIDQETAVTPAEAAREALLMGLRLSSGIDPAQFARHTGVSLPDAIDTDARQRLTDWKLLAPLDPLRTTAAGRPLLNRILAELASDNISDNQL
ncbi:MAG: coproporphyrinogen-III oxidase family protein, partial [Rhodospirillaceae bacterium]